MHPELFVIYKLDSKLSSWHLGPLILAILRDAVQSNNGHQLMEGTNGPKCQNYLV